MGWLLEFDHSGVYWMRLWMKGRGETIMVFGLWFREWDCLSAC